MWLVFVCLCFLWVTVVSTPATVNAEVGSMTYLIGQGCVSSNCSKAHLYLLPTIRTRAPAIVIKALLV